jgi:hypothetical protein
VLGVSRGALGIAFVLALAGGSAMAAWFAALVARRPGDHAGLLVLGFVVGAGGALVVGLFGWAVLMALGPEPERLPLRAGEETLLTRPANSRGLRGHGELVFTTKRLLFHAHKLSFRREPLEIDLGSIEDARPAGWARHLAVTVGGSTEIFIVDDHVGLAALIRQLAAAPEAERQAVFAAWRDEPPV